MGYLLDTNIISDLIRNPEGRAARALVKVGDDVVCTSILVAAELRYGSVKRGSARLTARLERLLRTIPVLPLKEPADETYGRIRNQLEMARQPIGANDLLIAAQAVSLELTLVTDNEREFIRVPGLRVENWLR